MSVKRTFIVYISITFIYGRRHIMSLFTGAGVADTGDAALILEYAAEKVAGF